MEIINIYKDVDKLINLLNNKLDRDLIIDETYNIDKSVIINTNNYIYDLGLLNHKYKPIYSDDDKYIIYEPQFTQLYTYDKCENYEYKKDNFFDYLFFRDLQDDYEYTYEDYSYVDEFIKFIIYIKQWNIIMEIINFEDLSIFVCNILGRYLTFYPDYILCKMLNNFIFTKSTYIMYYVNHKLNKTKHIPFELFPINDYKILYTFILLLNNKYFKIDDKYHNLIKFINIFNRLHYDMKLKMCCIKNINYNEIRLCSMYLIN